jgi:hypothetical protein
MAKYLVTYHNGQMPADPAVMEQAKKAFGQWLQSAGKMVVDPGAPVRHITQVASQNPAAPIEIGGYSVIESASKEQVIEILRNHPFVSRGGTLQVSELMGA